MAQKNQPDRDLCSFNSLGSVAVPNDSPPFHVFFSSLFIHQRYVYSILEFSQNEVGPASLSTSHRFGIYRLLCYIAGSLNSVELNWIRSLAQDESNTKRDQNSFLVFRLPSIFIFFFSLSLSVLFQSPTHDLTSLLVCLSARSFCFSPTKTNEWRR